MLYLILVIIGTFSFYSSSEEKRLLVRLLGRLFPFPFFLLVARLAIDVCSDCLGSYWGLSIPCWTVLRVLLSYAYNYLIIGGGGTTTLALVKKSS